MKRKTKTYKIEWVLYKSKLRPPEHMLPQVKMTIQDKLTILGFALSIGYFVVRGVFLK